MNAICRRPASTDSRSSTGSSRPASHWRPLTPNRSEHGGLSCNRRWSTAWISFFARVRARIELLAAREPTTQDPVALIRHPDRVKLPLPQQTRQGARVELVGLRASAADAGVIRTDHHHPLHVRLEEPSDLPTGTRHRQRHPVGRQQTLRQRS
jgi:hypothetical protein